MKKILFLHGLFASGNCTIANTLRNVLENNDSEKISVLTPDLPANPEAALELIHSICDNEHPDLIVSNSCGSFLAQIIAPIVGVPVLLSNPHFKMTEFLKERIGQHSYKSPRKDGNQCLVIDQQLIDVFARIEAHQFDWYSPFYKNKIWGVFGDNDTIAHFEPEFRQYYDFTFHFPTGHTPTENDIIRYYIPLIQRMLKELEKPADVFRYFKHFKGGLYKYIQTAYHSETKERMVIYQALYEDYTYWVRPERMFFEQIHKDGKTVNRFTEIDSAF